MSNITIRNHPKYPRIYVSGSLENPRLYTINKTPGKRVYDERLIHYEGIEYREWDPYRSKLAAIILQNPIKDYLRKGLNCLYLGAASGTTVSHLSDILEEGTIFAVEFAERSIRQLVQNTNNRENIIPILGDARHPADYSRNIFTDVDLIYQDVAQPNQAEIAISNTKQYLKEDGILILVIKTQSIDSISKSDKTYKKEKSTLLGANFEILETLNINRYAAEHMVLIAQKK